MAVFCYKPLKKPERLPDIFRSRREERGWSVASRELAGVIPAKYIQALEAGRFEQLPKARAHRLAYVRQYATILGLNPLECAEQFLHEQGLSDLSHEPKKTILTPIKNLSRATVSLFIRNAAVAAVIMLFIGYLGWQVKTIAEPPVLALVSPEDGMIVREKTITVEGTTSPGTKLTLNGQELTLDSKRSFRVPLTLTYGLNNLTFVAQKKRGKTTTRVVHVIVKADTALNSP